MWLAALRRLFSGPHKKIRPGRPAACRRRSRLLSFETLEDRFAPAIFTVNSLADIASPAAGTVTLRSAIAAANSDHNTQANNPDIINFSVNGTIQLTGPLPDLTGSVSIEGPGASKLTVLGGNGAQGGTLLVVDPTSSTAISGLTIDGNHANSEVGVNKGTLVLQADTLQNGVNNGTFAGGGLTNFGGNVTVNDSSIIGNHTGNSGGGVVSVDGTLTINQSTIANNSAVGDGGGISIQTSAAAASVLTLTDSTVSGNIAGAGGGGLILDHGAKTTIVDSTIADNVSQLLGGGGIGLNESSFPTSTDSLTISSSTISGNLAAVGEGDPNARLGGGIAVVFSSTQPLLTNTIVAGNGFGTVNSQGITKVTVPDDVLATLAAGSSYDLIGAGNGLSGITNGVNGNQIRSFTGYDIPTLTPSLPAYASVTSNSANINTWSAATGDGRALQPGSGGNPGNVAADWYQTNTFSINVDLRDGEQHQLALYALDWDNQGRSEKVQVLDANTDAVLDTETLSNFQNGTWLVWDVTGSVIVQVTNLNAATNAVLSGLFLSAGSLSSKPNGTFVKADTTTQGNWEGVYGSTATPNADLGPLANNGGPTQTMALLPGSSAIDRGGPDITAESVTTTDQTGNPRIVKQPFAVTPALGDGRDIGAYELPPQTPTILTVNSLADANPPAGVLTLREALEAATGAIPLSSLAAAQVVAGSSWYEIQFSVSGTIALASALPTINGNDAVTIQGPGAAKLTIQGDGHNDDAILTVAADADAVVSGVTLEPPSEGLNIGIIVDANASVLVQNAVIENTFNEDNSGGAIVNRGGDVSVNGTTFSNNIADALGGAIYSLGGSLSVTQSTLGGNDSLGGDGGAIFNAAAANGTGGYLTVLDSTFVNNFANFIGGAIDLDGGSYARVADSTFNANEAGSQGGAIALRYFVDIGANTSTILNLSSSTLSGNSVRFASEGGGGGIYVQPANANVTIDAVLQDTIVAGNLAGTGSSSTHNDITGPIDPSSSFNLIGDGTGLTGTSDGVNGNMVGGYTGYDIPTLTPSLPAYASVSILSANVGTWSASSGDVRALEPGSSGNAGRVAANWSQVNTFTINVNIRDGEQHQLALYALDWDNQGRSEKIQILDANTNQVLDTETVSNFQNGAYLVWDVTGSVIIQITTLNSSTAVLSGLFLSPGSIPSQPNGTFVKADTTTQGNWEGVYGIDGDINPQLGPLANNGGPTQTMALLPGSPAIDRGGPDELADSLTTTDQTGKPRIVKQNFTVLPTGGDGRDIGAYELPLQTTPTILTVNSLADANPPAGVLTLRQAVEAATGIIPLSSLPSGQVSAGSAYWYEIQFSVTGTISLASALPTITATDAVTIQGPGAAKLTIQGDGKNDDAILTVAAGAYAVVSGVTLESPSQELNMGVIVGADASLLVQNDVIENTFNINSSGSAIVNLGGSVSISRTLVSNNISDSLGGAIYSLGGSLTITQSTFSGNDSLGGDGGAIFNAAGPAGNGGNLTVLDSTFVNNSANFIGGAIDLDGGSTATIADSTFTANAAGSQGGAIALRYFVDIGKSTTTILNLSSSTLSGNSVRFASEGGGGALYIQPGNASVTIDASLQNTIVAGNFAGTSSPGTPNDINGPLDPTSAFNLIGDGSSLSGISNGTNGNQIGTDAQPLNPDLGPLANNGGPTQTMALLGGSPALNAGSGAATTDTDQRGQPRINIIDIGAYQGTPAHGQAVAGTPQSATVGSIFATPLQALVTDSFNQIVPGASVTFTVQAGAGGAGATFTGGVTTATVLAGANGVAMAPAFRANSHAGTFTVTATANVGSSHIPLATFTLTNTAATAGQSLATSLKFVQQAAATVAGQTITAIQVEILDQFAQVFAGDSSDTITLTGAPFLSGSTVTATVKNGVASFANLVIDQAGSYTLTAAAVGLAVATSSLMVSPAAASQLVLSGLPSAAFTGVLTPFTVTALDAYNNLATGYNGTLHFSSSDTAAILSADSTLTNGTGTFDIIFETGGTQSVTVTDTQTSSLTISQSGINVTLSISLIGINPGPASTFVVSNLPAPATAGTPFNFLVTAQDANGNVATGYTGTVHISSTSPNVVLPADATLTGGLGIFRIAFDKAGTDSFTVSDSMNTTLNSGTVNVTVAAAVAAAGKANAGTPQTAIAGTAFATQLQALVTDVFGNPVSGAMVTFTIQTAGAGTGTFAGGMATATALSDMNGLATAPAITAGNQAGSFTVTATTTISGQQVTIATYTLAVLASRPTGIITTDMPTFAWAPVTGAVHYDLWVDDLTANQSQVLRLKDVPGTSLNLSANQALTPGHSYAWYVGAVNAKGVETWSSGYSFSITALSAPAINGPTGTINTDQPTISWTAVTGAATYEIDLIDQSTRQALDIPHVTGTSLTLTAAQALTPGHSYTLWLGAISTNGLAAAWSHTTFSIAPLANPTISSPSGTISTDQPTISWTSVAGAATYEIYLGDQNSGQSLLIPNVTGTSLTLTAAQALTPGHSYTLWIGAVSTNGLDVAWSNSKFSIAALANPTITSPSGTISTDQPTISWTAVTGVATYEIYIGDQTSGQSLLIPKVTGTSVTLTAAQALTPGHSYTLWVGAVSTNGLATAWSNGKFSIAALANPTITAPSGTISTDQPTISWTSVTGAATYEIYLGDQTTGKSLLIPKVTGTSVTLTAAQALTPGDSYTLWVGAVSTNGLDVAWSNSKFSIAALSSPTVTSPSGTINTDQPTISWTAVTGAATYEIYLIDRTTGKPLIIPNLTGTSLTLSAAQALTPGHSFTLWVAAVSTNGLALAWSNTQSFAVAT